MSRRREIALAVGTAIVTGVALLTAGTAAGQDPAATPSPTASQSPGASPSPSASASPGPPRAIMLTYVNPPPSDPSRPCETGYAYKTNGAGDVDRLVVCTFNETGNPSSTDDDEAHLVWRIDPSYPPAGPMVRFSGDPPTETTASGGGRAEVEIEAINGGDGFIVVDMVTSDGDVIGSASVEKFVHEEDLPPRDVRTKVKARRVPYGLRGRLETEERCRQERAISLFRRTWRIGNPRMVASGFTDKRGRWRFRMDRRGTYFVQVDSVYLSEEPDVNCLSDKSEKFRFRHRP